MWKCHKCGKPVYFAERKQSMGFDFHPECLRCKECDKRLNPGRHAEHKGEPYCHTPCYSVLFGPTLYGHGSQVETHTSFGKCEKVWPASIDKAIVEAKLKVYNHYYDGNSGQLKWKERSNQLILEGQLHIYWGVDNLIHLKENDDQRHHVQLRKRYSCREAFYKLRNNPTITDPSQLDLNDNIGKLNKNEDVLSLQATSETGNKTVDANNYENASNLEDESEKKVDCGEAVSELNAIYQNNSDVNRSANENLEVDLSPCSDPSMNVTTTQNGSSSEVNLHLQNSVSSPSSEKAEEVITRLDRKPLRNVDLSRVQVRKLTSSRSKTRLKRRCSINGHYYNRETKIFTPPKGSASNVWVSSLATTKTVISLLLDKFRIENQPDEFALFIVRDNGEIRRIKDDDFPLIARILLGPHEQVAKVFIMDRKNTNEVSNEVAQYLNFQEPELIAILQKFDEEEANECIRIKLKFDEMRRRMSARLDYIHS